MNRGIINPAPALKMFSDNLDKAVKMFLEFSQQNNPDSFLELHELKKSLFSEQEAKKFIESFLQKNNIRADELKHKDNCTIRDELIRQLKTRSTLTIKQVSEVLNLGKGIVQRVKPD
jgi:hypothetical protein